MVIGDGVNCGKLAFANRAPVLITTQHRAPCPTQSVRATALEKIHPIQVWARVWDKMYCIDERYIGYTKVHGKEIVEKGAEYTICHNITKAHYRGENRKPLSSSIMYEVTIGRQRHQNGTSTRMIFIRSSNFPPTANNFR